MFLSVAGSAATLSIASLFRTSGLEKIMILKKIKKSDFFI